MSESADEISRIATRKAVDLIDRLEEFPRNRDGLIELVALAWLQGGRDQLAWAQSLVKGDAS